MSDNRVDRLAKQLLGEGYLDDADDALLAARRIIWVVDDRPGEPPVDTEALPAWVIRRG